MPGFNPFPYDREDDPGDYEEYTPPPRTVQSQYMNAEVFIIADAKLVDGNLEVRDGILTFKDGRLIGFTASDWRTQNA